MLLRSLQRYLHALTYLLSGIRIRNPRALFLSGQVSLSLSSHLFSSPLFEISERGTAGQTVDFFTLDFRTRVGQLERPSLA